MNNTLRIILKKYNNTLLILICSFVLLPEAVGVIVFLLLFVFACYNFIFFKIEKANKIILLCCSIIPFIYLISIVYSNNKILSFDYFVRSMLFIITPTIFFGLFKKVIANNKSHLLILSTLLISSILKLAISLTQDTMFSVSSFWKFRVNLENATDIHGTYWGIFFGCIVLISFNKLLFTKIYFKQYLTIIIISFIFLLLSNSKMPLISLLFVLCFLMIKKYKAKGFFYGLITIVILASVVYTIPFTQKRYFKEVSSFSNKINYPEGIYNINHKKISSLSVRYGVYTCAYNCFIKKPFFGYGSGDVQDTLDYCYFSNYNTNLYLIKKLNSHNQYLGFLLNNGLLGLILFLFCCFMAFKYVIDNNNVIGISILIFFTLCMLTENIIDRHYGALIVTFFISSFTFLKPIKND